jgi:RsiW-degrading membrane proteinase PrsW (M82 family)
MPAILVFPAATYALLLIVYVRAFIRSTGLTVKIFPVALFSLLGAAATLAAYVVLSTLRELLPANIIDYAAFISPFTEELIKYAFLSFAVRRVLITSEPLQRFRQRILSALIVGLSFGLVETYLYLFTNLTLLTGSMLLGSIPLHLGTGGFLGYVSAMRRPAAAKAVLIALIIAFHLGYNQIVMLPPPLSYLSFIMLLAAAIFLLNLITSPRDYMGDKSD